jgi:hypothetical protein
MTVFTTASKRRFDRRALGTRRGCQSHFKRGNCVLNGTPKPIRRRLRVLSMFCLPTSEIEPTRSRSIQ